MTYGQNAPSCDPLIKQIHCSVLSGKVDVCCKCFKKSLRNDICRGVSESAFPDFVGHCNFWFAIQAPESNPGWKII